MEKEKYFKITNNDGKVWILPSKKLSIGLNLYQPSSFKGIVLKICLPVAWKIWGVKCLIEKILHIQKCDIEVPHSVLAFLKKAYMLEDTSFSFFGGTPCIHQKGTIQISCKNDILGYLKFSNEPAVVELFQKESKVLEWLEECNVKNIPACVACEEVENGLTIFLQDTKRTPQSKTSHKLSKRHIEFLFDMYQKTKVECDFRDTDFYKQIEELKNKLSDLDFLGMDISALVKAIKIVDDSLQNEKCYSAYHGDFTPWNTLIMEDGKLYVFDFEYAKKTFPKNLDAFHFFTQTMIYQKQKSGQEIIKEFEKRTTFSTFKKMFCNPYVSYLQYLVAIMAFYVERDKGSFDETNIRNFKVWNDLLKIILNRLS